MTQSLNWGTNAHKFQKVFFCCFFFNCLPFLKWLPAHPVAMLSIKVSVRTGLPNLFQQKALEESSYLKMKGEKWNKECFSIHCLSGHWGVGAISIQCTAEALIRLFSQILKNSLHTCICVFGCTSARVSWRKGVSTFGQIQDCHAHKRVGALSRSLPAKGLNHTPGIHNDVKPTHIHTHSHNLPKLCRVRPFLEASIFNICSGYIAGRYVLSLNSDFLFCLFLLLSKYAFQMITVTTLDVCFYSRNI